MDCAAPARPRNTERCPQCGYSLQGLSDEGRCPECGRKYDQSQISLEGWAAGGSPFASRRPMAIWHSFCLGGIPGAVLAMHLPRRLLWIAALPPVLAIIGHIAIRVQKDDVPPMLLVLSPNGYWADSHPSAGLSSSFHNVATLVAAGAWILLVTLDNPGYVAVLLAGVFVVAGLLTVMLHRRARRERPPSVATISLSGQPVNLAPWRPNSQVIFKPRRPGTWHLTIGVKSVPFYRFSRERAIPPQCFEVDLSDDRLAHITGQIAKWPVQLVVTGV